MTAGAYPKFSCLLLTEAEAEAFSQFFSFIFPVRFEAAAGPASLNVCIS